MWELIKSGGWIMLLIVVCSIIAVPIVVERLWTLRPSRVSPPQLLAQVWRWVQTKKMDGERFAELSAG